jgi:uncharacterized protein with GYD domain
MPKFLVKANYTQEGARGVMREGGSGRREAAKTAIESLGGTLEAFYFAFGEHDAYLLMDLPSQAAASALALRVNQAGGARIQTVVLQTPEEVDEAVKMSVSYRPPGD